jgi:uroporphyrinogen decarboxylase
MKDTLPQRPGISDDLRARSGLNAPEASRTLTGAQRFIRACLRQPVDVPPVWFLRQAGRYMPEYQAVRRHHSLIEICKQPDLAADVTITAAEKLGVDAAIIFADLLLPFECMGLPFEFRAGEGRSRYRSATHRPCFGTWLRRGGNRESCRAFQ